MKNKRTVIAGLITAAALAASSSFVYAQQAEQTPGQSGQRGEMHHGPGAGHMRHGHHGHHGHHRHHGKWSNPKAAVEGHLASLKVELKITPNQESAWQAYANKTRQRVDAMIARHDAMKARHEQRKAQGQAQAPATSMTAPERMAKRIEFMKQHVAGMEARAAAVRDLYAVLTPEQQALADKQFSRGHKGGFHRGGFGEHQRG